MSAGTEKDTVVIYTDGACEGNPGPGGWAAVIRYLGVTKEISGGCPATTNNRMELQAAIEALSALKRRDLAVCLYTDSEYLMRGISEWLPSWKRRGWRTASKQPVKNVELWKQLDSLASDFEISWRWVKGHAGNGANERCDQLAREEIGKIKRSGLPKRPKASTRTQPRQEKLFS